MAQCSVCGKSGLLLRLTSSGLCLSCAEQEIQRLNQLLTPQHHEAADLFTLCSQRRSALEHLRAEVSKQEAALKDIRAKIRAHSSELIVIDEALEMEIFALYKPRFAFTQSEEYRDALSAIRNRQKQLIRDHKAAVCDTECKKQEEKEELAALRAQQREEAKLAKEIEAARKEAEKERKHYQQALEKLRTQLITAPSDQHADLLARQDELLNQLDDIEQRMADIDYRLNNQRAGYVYIISNIGSFGEGVFKIGMTRRSSKPPCIRPLPLIG